MDINAPLGDLSLPEGATPAAVLVPIVDGLEPPHLLFTKRAPDLDTHPGQMSFPGGRVEDGDATLRETALRETQEELGIDRALVEIVGQLEPISTVTGFHVEPLIGRIPAGPYTPNPAEVAEVITLPESAFIEFDSYEQERREHPDRGEMAVHYFHIGAYTVWGATASILIQYLERETGWEPPDES